MGHQPRESQRPEMGSGTENAMLVPENRFYHAPPNDGAGGAAGEADAAAAKAAADAKAASDAAAAEAAKAKANGKDDDSDLPEAARAELHRLRKVNADLNRENAKRRAEASKFDGIDTDRYAALIAEEEKRAEEQSRKDGEFDKLLAKEREKTTLEKARADKVQADWHAAEIRREVHLGAIALGATKLALTPMYEKGPSQIEAMYTAQFEIVEGETVHKHARNDDGTRMNVRQFFDRERKAGASNLFETQQKGGTGAGAGGSDSASEAVIKRDDPQRSVKVQAAIKAGKKPVFTD